WDAVPDGTTIEILPRDPARCPRRWQSIYPPRSIDEAIYRRADPFTNQTRPTADSHNPLMWKARGRNRVMRPLATAGLRSSRRHREVRACHTPQPKLRPACEARQNVLASASWRG